MPMTPRRAIRLASLVVVLALSAVVRADEKSAPLYQEARQKLRARDTAGAMKFLAAAVAADPEDADAQILYQDLLRKEKPEKALVQQYAAASAAKADSPLLAYLAARLLKPEEAVSKFGTQAQKFPASPWPHEGRAAALDALGKTKEASAAHDAAVAASPREPRFRVSQARGYEHAGQWAQAAEIWKLALALRPTDTSLILGLGEAHRRGGAFDEAIAQFEAAAKLDPKDPEPPYRIGLTRLDGRAFDEALKSFNAAIALDKGYVEAYAAAVRASVTRARDAANRAKRDLVESDFKTAIDYGTRAIQAAGTDPLAHMALAAAEEAAAEIASGHGGVALREYDAALTFLPATNPDRVRALVGRAYVLLLEANHDESLATADKAIDQDPRAVTAYLAAGRALAGKGDHENAVKKYYNPALKLAPDDAALLHARGISLWMTGKTGDAKKDLEACVAKEPKNGRFQLSLGELYYALKNYPPARTALVAAADLRPRDPEAWRALGFACTSLKDWEQAAAAFEEVVLLIEGGGAPAGGDPAAPPAPDSPPPGNGAPPAPTNPAPPGGTLPSSPGNPPPAPPAPPAQPPADPPPANPPASPPADPPAQPPAGGGDPPKAPAEPKFATNEHLWLTLLYADSLKQRDKAKAHAKKWVEQGGKNPDLDSWVQSLLSEK